VESWSVGKNDPHPGCPSADMLPQYKRFLYYKKISCIKISKKIPLADLIF
jgi:hypothetical protein